jgi:hypothetical protein
MSHSESTFEVQDHYELPSRGAFVIGRIVAGVVRPGMRAQTGLDPAQLEVAGVEFLDNVTDGTFKNALVFADRPSLAFVKQAFPIGFVIDLG